MQDDRNDKKEGLNIDDNIDSMLGVLKNRQSAPMPPAAPAQPPADKPAAKKEAAPVHKPNKKEVFPLKQKKPKGAPVVDFDDIDPETARIRKSKILSSTARSGKTAAVALGKIIGYIVFVVAVSVFISVNVINVANDIFAFVKDDTPITVTIPEGADTKLVAKILHDNGLIKYPSLFKNYTSDKIKDSKYLTGQYKSGEFELNGMMNYDTLISTLSIYTKTQRESVRVTIPEGYTVDQIIDLLLEKGVGQREDYIDAIDNYDYNYLFVKQIKENPDRKYRLEGYLFPDTYDFFTDEKEISVINKMLQNFNIKFEEEYYARAKELGMTVDEVITIASIVEKEGKYASDLAVISSVFHNRLAPSSTIRRLQSDATVMYALPERKTSLTSADLAVDSPYNSYTNDGLIPGAICNPGLDAINAAFYPEKTSYYYFFSTKDGHTVFSQTNAQHETRQQQERAKGNF